jgi:predicted anti-sigma-YlaC factor YlaD
MGKINVGRVILGGIVAGIVSDILGYLVDGVLLAQRWAGEMSDLGRQDFSTNQIIGFNLLGLASGIALIWVYAAIRPRFGAGAMTAIYAGLAVWFIGVLIPNTGFMVVAHIFGKHLALYTTSGGLVETLAGALAGAALYKEEPSA